MYTLNTQCSIWSLNKDFPSCIISSFLLSIKTLCVEFLVTKSDGFIPYDFASNNEIVDLIPVYHIHTEGMLKTISIVVYSTRQEHTKGSFIKI